MIIDGRKIAEHVYEDLTKRVAVLPRAPRFSIITCDPNFETQKYLALKKRKAHAVGIATDVIELPHTSSTADVLACIKRVSEMSDGVIVQLPLPQGIDRDAVVRAIPVTKDVDALNDDTTEMYSPVVCAIQEILKVHEITAYDAQVAIIGNGKLVGLPAYRWFMTQGSHISLVTRDVEDIALHTKHADIIVCGAGVPGLLTPDMVRDGVIILDAGTSEDGGELRGDADPQCAEKARLFTPVPGGIGPMTIAMLLKNVVHCAEEHNHVI